MLFKERKKILTEDLVKIINFVKKHKKQKETARAAEDCRWLLNPRRNKTSQLSADNNVQLTCSADVESCCFQSDDRLLEELHEDRLGVCCTDAQRR